MIFDMTGTDAFPWLPIGYEVASGCAVGRLIQAQRDYQLVRAKDSAATIFLIASDTALAASVKNLLRSYEKMNLYAVNFGDVQFFAVVFDEDNTPTTIFDFIGRRQPITSTELVPLAEALVALADEQPNACWGDAIYFPGLRKCVATTDRGSGEDRLALVVRLLTGGIADPNLSSTQIHAVNPWLTTDEIEDFFVRVGVTRSRVRAGPTLPQIAFSLPGRPDLEALFREYVVDYFRDSERYQKMGVRPSGGFLLYGPPGTGKTYAARQLAAYLKWPVFEIEIGGVGSPYIHQTSVQLRRTFDQAAAKAPALIVLNEFDALASSRGGTSQEHKIEEVAEMLRLIETASERSLVVIATTNRRAAIDDAMLRRGRFDHIVHVDYPTAIELRAALSELIGERPHAAGINVDEVAERLQKRPMSDASWVINEAARLAVKANKDEIDDICLFQALSKLK